MTTGKHWKRKKGVKWTEEMNSWLKERCPAREHGYSDRRAILDELNAAFGTDFSLSAFVTHCYENGVQFGFVSSQSGIPRGEKHWRHRPIGSFQVKKGYVRIKVAEPNKWMCYQRYVWEQSHPGESAEGMTVIFMDGDNRNFAPENLERVSRGELCVMAEMGHSKDMTREEREICLLRARVAISKGRLVGDDGARRLRQKAGYERRKNDPAFRLAQKANHERYWRSVKSDPARYEEILRRNREYRRNKARGGK
ncbi:MAG: HNH endonuclease [Lachnospiraceae bacterium]|nr:HNH endonuclease [Lachnospiraceae bacterium]